METLTAKNFRFSDFELDGVRRLLLKDGEPLSLNPKAFELLLTLVESRGEVLSKDDLLERVWPGQFIEEGNLKVHISALRKALNEGKNDHRFIVTVPGRGYSFVAELEKADESEIVIENHRLSRIIVKEEISADDVVDIPDPRQVPALLGASTRSRKTTAAIGVSLAILVIAGGYWFFRAQPESGRIERVAVMPFINDSGDPDLEYLSDGMTESLINSLSGLPNLAVKARGSVFRYKGSEVLPTRVGSDLNVQAILNGRVVERDGQLTLYLSLVDARTGDQIWGDQYERKIGDALSFQTEIARDVSRKLRAKLSDADEQKIAKNYTANPDAYILYLKGRFYWNKRSAKDLRKAIEFFEQATQVDPNYALAFAGLADALSLLPNFGGAPAHEAKPKARTAALKALSLDESLAEAPTALGGILGDYDFDFAGEEREYKLAIELNPNYATVHHWYAELLMRNGRFDEAELEFRRALDIDPLSLPIARNYSDSLHFAGKHDASFAELRKIVELDPLFLHAYESLANLNQTVGNYAECAEGYAKVEELMGEKQFAEQMRASYSQGGWQGFLTEMTGNRKPTNLPSYIVATFQTANGDKDGAFASLNASYEKREAFILGIKVDPRLGPLRDDPRFHDLMARVGY